VRVPAENLVGERRRLKLAQKWLGRARETWRRALGVASA
jgi:hypothetical protein